MKRFLHRSILPVGLGMFVLLMWLALQGVTIDVLQPSGKIAAEQLKLLYFTLALSLLVIVPVFTMLAVFALKYREGRKSSDYKPEWDGSARLEALWWGIPIAIIGVLGVVTVQTSHSLDPYKPIASDKKTIEVQVVALQWKWLFIYPKYEIATVNHLPLPVDTPVHFNIAADAPMSAFWIPSMGSQIYSMNGMNSQLNLLANKTGTYTGYNTNINGEGYAKMKFKVDVMPEQKFDEWASSAGRKAMEAGDHMDLSTYNVLAKPSTIEQPQTYHLMEPELYDTILAKYMSHGSTQNHDDAPQSTGDMHHSSMNHGGTH